MRRIKYSTKGNQIKVEKTRFRKVKPENDVILDAKSNQRDKPQKNIGKFGDIGSFVDSGTRSILVENREIAQVFWANSAILGPLVCIFFLMPNETSSSRNYYPKMEEYSLRIMSRFVHPGIVIEIRSFLQQINFIHLFMFNIY